jgi:hypothetical protein
VAHPILEFIARTNHASMKVGTSPLERSSGLMEVITGGIMQAQLSVALFPTNRLELSGFLLIHKFASLAFVQCFWPIVLVLSSLVAVSRTVRRYGNYSLKWKRR